MNLLPAASLLAAPGMGPHPFELCCGQDKHPFRPCSPILFLCLAVLDHVLYCGVSVNCVCLVVIISYDSGSLLGLGAEKEGLRAQAGYGRPLASAVLNGCVGRSTKGRQPARGKC